MRCVSYIGYLTHRNSKGGTDTRERCRHPNHSKRVKILEERNMGTKGINHTQGQTNTKDIIIEYPEG